MPQTIFFQSQDELRERLESLKREYSLQYALLGMHDIARPDMFSDIWLRKGFGVSQTGNEASDERFLVVPEKVVVQTQKVEMKNGTVSYFLHAGLNPTCIVFAPGGRFGTDCLMAGHVWFEGGNQAAKVLYSEFKRNVLKGCRTINGYRISRDACEWGRSGKRLVIRSAYEDAIFDLKL